jgi:hypothetical protein
MFWHYQTSDTLSAVLRPGYFDDMVDVIRDGDWIACNSMRADALGCEAMLLIVQSVGQVQAMAKAEHRRQTRQDAAAMPETLEQQIMGHACAEIDRLRAENAELLATLEKIKSKAALGLGITTLDEIADIAGAAIAAIAKARIEELRASAESRVSHYEQERG